MVGDIFNFSLSVCMYKYVFKEKCWKKKFKSHVSMELVLEHFSIKMVKIMKRWKLSLKLFKLDFETLHIRCLLRIQYL